MPFNTKSLIVDAYNRIVAQYFNPITDKYEAVEGADGATNVQLTGSNLQEQKTQANAVAGVLTFSAPISTIEIYNTDTTNAGTFVVNGLTINVPAGKVYKSGIGGTPGNTVTVSGATTYIVSRYT